jgi:hypothetical protein
MRPNYGFKRTAGRIHHVSCCSVGPRPLNPSLDWCAIHPLACCSSARCRAQQPLELGVPMKSPASTQCAAFSRRFSSARARSAWSAHLGVVAEPCRRLSGLFGWSVVSVVGVRHSRVRSPASASRSWSNGSRPCNRFQRRRHGFGAIIRCSVRTSRRATHIGHRDLAVSERGALARRAPI